MIGIDDLARAATAAFEWARRQPDVREVEVFVAANALLLTRLNYTSHIACNGVEEPKSAAAHGIGIQAVFAGSDGDRVGFGSEPSDLTLRGVERALTKARRAAVRDPEFVSLPKPVSERPTPGHLTAMGGQVHGRHLDPALMTLDDRALVDAGWKVLNGALRTFVTSGRLTELAGGEAGLRALGLIVGGDVSVVQERIAIVSTHLPTVQTDESTLITASVTAMVEARDAKGSGWSTGTRLDHFTDEAGVEAAQNAIAAIDGVRVPSGTYTVMFGRQPMADLLNNLVVPGCTASSFYASNTPFLGRLGTRVASPLLNLYDHGAATGLIASKAITCEGLPTGRTDLIREGVLAGCLSSWYETQRLLRDPARAEKLGGASDDERRRALAPRNGFRFAPGGGRQFDTSPSVSASNVVLEAEEAVSRDELLRRVGDGLYIGRIWYTYPVNGLRAGDFTCTVVGDSYIIRDGRIAEPLRANVIRVNDNIATILNNVVGVTKDVRGTVVWAEVAYTPELAVSGVRVDAIAGFMEDLT
jgi:predicted Zn-dependent protease